MDPKSIPAFPLKEPLTSDSEGMTFNVSGGLPTHALAVKLRRERKRAKPAVANRLERSVRRLTEEPMAGLDNGTWHCMTEAPRDGTEVELLLRHTNYRYCETDEQREQWEQAVRAKWIDFNGGGWTWHGMAGAFVGWRPLPSNAI